LTSSFPPAALREERIRQLLAGDPFVSRLIVLETTGSTNEELRRLAAEGASEGTTVIANHQSAGRGRLGRSWHSPPGLGLYLSVLFREFPSVEEITRWTLAASLAACESCRRVADRQVAVRWPNDLVHGTRKLGGILAELRSAGERPRDLVIGLGLNVLHAEDSFPAELRDRATSLRSLPGRGILEREVLAADILIRLGEVRRRLLRGEWETIAGEWERRAPGARGTRVRVLSRRSGSPGEPLYEGVTRGIDGRGALLVQQAEGKVMAVHMAETVVPLEG
jgi:BirA family biotin operon repressor/biotin-[acetyl-CoA-carboxylase] ligase